MQREARGDGDLMKLTQNKGRGGGGSLSPKLTWQEDLADALGLMKVSESLENP